MEFDVAGEGKGKGVLVGDGGRNKGEFKSCRIRLLLRSIYTGSMVDFTHGTCDLPNY